MGYPRLLVLAGIVLIKLASNPSAATRIECLDTRPGWLTDTNVEFVFDGTVVAEEAAWPGLVRSTVAVHRVWKGEVPRRFVVHGIGEIDGIPKLTDGKRYVAAASSLRVHRPIGGLQGLPDSAVLVRACSAYQFESDYTDARIRRELGRGWPPSQ